MRLALLFVLLLAVSVALPACSPGVNPTTGPTSPTGANVTGTWTGSAIDSSGSPMGSGLTNGTLMTWQLTENGNAQVTGTITFAGVTPTPGQPQVVTSVTGAVAPDGIFTFTVNIPAGLSPAFPTCSATVTGSMTPNPAATQMTGTYSGNNTCSGTISNGQITLTKQ